VNEYKTAFDVVLKELVNINYEEYCNKVFKRFCIPNTKRKWIDKRYNTFHDGWTCDWSCGSLCHIFICVFGKLYICEKTFEIKKFKPLTHYYICLNYCRSGIEVLGMTPNRTTDGKYKYEGTSIKELKEACKKNGIKGYSKLDKCDLVKLLMKC
jgi:hypothetical protein